MQILKWLHNICVPLNRLCFDQLKIYCPRGRLSQICVVERSIELTPLQSSIICYLVTLQTGNHPSLRVWMLDPHDTQSMPQRIHIWVILTPNDSCFYDGSSSYSNWVNKRLPESGGSVSIFHLPPLMLFISPRSYPQETSAKHLKTPAINLCYLHNSISASAWLWMCLSCFPSPLLQPSPLPLLSFIADIKDSLNDRPVLYSGNRLSKNKSLRSYFTRFFRTSL